MKRSKMIVGIWIMFMTLVSVSALTTYFISGLRYSVFRLAYIVLFITQLFALTVYLIGEEKVTNLFIKILYRLCFIASFTVIPAFSFIFTALISQYHAILTDAIPVEYEDAKSILPKEETTIYKTDSLYIIFPKYDEIELVCKDKPKKSDKSISWSSSAAFQHELALDFSQLNIEGYHASKGEYYDSPYIHDESAAFTFCDGQFKFEFDDPEAAIKEAASKGGSGFMQYGIIRDREVVYSFSRIRSYRLLAELNGNVCIIDSINMLNFEDFLVEVQKLGVTNALYMDMGAGWNHSWYRKPNGGVKILFPLEVAWEHNWLVFKTT